MQTIYDTSVFILIIARTFVQARNKRFRGERSLQSFIAAQGIVYFLYEGFLTPGPSRMKLI